MLLSYMGELVSGQKSYTGNTFVDTIALHSESQKSILKLKFIISEFHFGIVCK
jgi:hypothetical protein